MACAVPKDRLATMVRPVLMATMVPPAPDTRSRGNVSALHHHHHLEQLPIDAATLPPHWHGEGMDLGLAVEGLLARDGRLNPGQSP